MSETYKPLEEMKPEEIWEALHPYYGVDNCAKEKTNRRIQYYNEQYMDLLGEDTYIDAENSQSAAASLYKIMHDGLRTISENVPCCHNCVYCEYDEYLPDLGAQPWVLDGTDTMSDQLGSPWSCVNQRTSGGKVLRMDTWPHLVCDKFTTK